MKRGETVARVIRKFGFHICSICGEASSTANQFCGLGQAEQLDSVVFAKQELKLLQRSLKALHNCEMI